MRLEPLYRLRIKFSERTSVIISGESGKEDQVLHFAEGTVEGGISGRFRGMDYPRRRTDGTVVTDLRAVIETSDAASILFDCHGYGRVHSAERDHLSGGPRQWVVAVTHLSDHEQYRRLNDTICVGTGHSPRGPRTASGQPLEFVLDVAEIIWEPILD